MATGAGQSLQSKDFSAPPPWSSGSCSGLWQGCSWTPSLPQGQHFPALPCTGYPRTGEPVEDPSSSQWRIPVPPVKDLSCPQ